MKILAPISVGELYDKITILELKLQYIKNIDKIKNVLHELKNLREIRDNYILPETIPEVIELKSVNNELWHIEEFKRAREKEKIFDNEFIEAARQVYLKNDQRADLKAQINRHFGSEIAEAKSHK